MLKLLLHCLFLFIIAGTNAQCWKMIAPGGSGHTLAVKTDGTLWATGYNIAGQLGDSTTIDKNTFIQIGNDSDWSSVSAYAERSYAIKTNGTLWAWGLNFDNQLGLNSWEFNFIVPTKVAEDTNWLAIGSEHSSAFGISTLVLKTNNTLWNLYRTPTQIGAASNWKITSVGESHNLAIRSDGSLWGWGANNFGQLGLSIIDNFPDPLQIGNENNWRLVSAGKDHSLAIKTDGTLWASGGNSTGQLGDGTLIEKHVFTKIDNSTNWKTVAAADYHSFATKTDGTLWVWGRDQEGELGIGNSGSMIVKMVPTLIDNATNWDSVIAGGNTAFALKNDGTLWAWGYNNFGQVGDGTLTNKIVPVSISCNSLVLPIQLSSFFVQKKANTVVLTWQTQKELNSKEYQLQRSNDGVRFNSITSITSNNNIIGSRYTYTDSFPSSGLNYYRIKSIDIDDRFSYSSTQTINFDLSANQINLFPNPIKNTFWLSTSFKSDKLYISIFDLSGRKLISQSNSNSNPASISIAQLKAGIYIINISDGINSENKKIIKE